MQLLIPVEAVMVCLVFHRTAHETFHVAVSQVKRNTAVAAYGCVLCRHHLDLVQYADPCWLCAVSQEIAEELGILSSDSSEEDVLTTRVVRRRVIIQVKKHVTVQPGVLWSGEGFVGYGFGAP